MVICKFFQNGNCRFGTKCANEHFDVKQLLRTEIEAAIEGTQWPLSSFGPFKEKPCFPNFIEDQSFEEIRNLCYEARKQNYFQNFEQQFNQQLMDARSKMQTLLTLNREIIDVVTSIYDSNTDGSNSGLTSANVNPFSTIGSGINDAQQSSSLFGNNQIQPTQQVNPFSKPNPVGNSGTFGNVGGTSIFASQTPNANSGILGQSSFGSSLFAGASAIAGQQQSSIFSPTTVQQPQQQQTFGGFAQPQSNSTNIFAQQASQTSGSMFGNQIQTQASQPFGANIFVQPKQTSQSNQSSIFGQPVIGNIFNQSLQQEQIQQQPQQQNIFGGFVQSTPFSAQQPSTFAAPQNQQQNMFAVSQTTQPAQQNLYAQQNSSQQIFSGNQQSNQAFAQINTTQGQQQKNFFNQPQQTVIKETGIFQQQPTQPSQFHQNSQIRAGIYSKIEDLSAEVLEVFKADKFTLENIPYIPPPRELC